MITLAAALGRATDHATLLPFAWGGWMLVADMGDHIDGYPIATHPTVAGLLIEGYGDLPDLDADSIAAIVLGAINRGAVLRWGAWRDVSARVARSDA